MPLPAALSGRLRIPAVASPMFLTSGPDLVVEVCRAGVLGTFPALNARTSEGFSQWLDDIDARLADAPGAAPYGVNLIVHKSNPRLQADLAICARHKVPVVITSLGAVKDLVDVVHGYGGLVFHDVISRRHAEKAAEAGVDGIIAVSAGAGGHAGTISPFALVSEIRRIFDGTILMAGAINTGAQILAARAAGADLAYMGTRFIATREAMVSEGFKDMILASSAADIFYTSAISGVNANFLRPSIVAAGLDPDNLKSHGALDMASEAKAWKTIWSAGQGVGGIDAVMPAAELCDQLAREYRAAVEAAAADPFVARMAAG
ncbi:nitronate monooxygenase family protein [Xanthobacter sp. V3C-3]|uniref:NAD(P)H-dependent flavin oxidoreductase n=1 Tax=Xanthobacter lutulentifluminis TaxID=3119935 RepID=UPI003726D0ED